MPSVLRMYTENYNMVGCKFFFPRIPFVTASTEKKVNFHIYTLTAKIGAKFHSSNMHNRKHTLRNKMTPWLFKHAIMRFVVKRSAPTVHVSYLVRKRTRMRIRLSRWQYNCAANIASKMKPVQQKRPIRHTVCRVQVLYTISESWFRKSSCKAFWAAETALRKDKLLVHHCCTHLTNHKPKVQNH